MRAFIIVLGLSGSLAVLVHGQDVLEPLALEKSADQLIEGSVDWTNQLLTVYGEGIAPENINNPVRRRLMGFRAAKVGARRNLLEMVPRLQPLRILVRRHADRSFNRCQSLMKI